MNLNGTVERAAFNSALKTLKRFARKRVGESLWRLAPDGLQVDWAGMSLPVPGAFDGELLVHVAEPTMGMIVGGPFAGAGSANLQVSDGKLRIDKMSFPCSEATTAVPQLIPVDASPIHVVLVSFLHTAEEIEAAGVSERVAEALEKKQKAISAAAKALSWLNIPELALTELVDKHLAAQATGKRVPAPQPVATRTVVVDPKGQVELL